jgi:gamma-glutamyl-gamma-aminobutyrate hydrolase PuuD
MNLQGWRYHVVGRDQSLELMMDNALSVRTSLKEADIIIFSGGTDISPTIYGEFAVHPLTQRPDRRRDALEGKIYLAALAKKKVLVGVCRGAQLLNCLNGGTLWQHVDNHRNTTHMVTYTGPNGDRYGVITTSDHHQMMRPAKHARILGVCNKATVKCTATEEHPADDIDAEIVWYPRTKSLCYQPHPEWGLASDRNLFVDCVKRVMIGA